MFANLQEIEQSAGKGGRRAHRQCRVEDEKPEPLAGLREVHPIDGRPVVGDLEAPCLGFGLWLTEP